MSEFLKHESLCQVYRFSLFNTDQGGWFTDDDAATPYDAHVEALQEFDDDAWSDEDEAWSLPQDVTNPVFPYAVLGSQRASLYDSLSPIQSFRPSPPHQSPLDMPQPDTILTTSGIQL